MIYFTLQNVLFSIKKITKEVDVMPAAGQVQDCSVEGLRPERPQKGGREGWKLGA